MNSRPQPLQTRKDEECVRVAADDQPAPLFRELSRATQHKQRRRCQQRLHARVEHLASLIDDLHRYNPKNNASAAIEITLMDFCNVMKSIARGSGGATTITKGQMHQIMIHLDEQHSGMDAILHILRNPNFGNAEIYKWSLAALIWFVHESEHRATRAVTSGATQSIVRLMRKYREVKGANRGREKAEGCEMLQCAAMSAIVQLMRNAETDALRECIHATLQQQCEDGMTGTSDQNGHKREKLPTSTSKSTSTSTHNARIKNSAPIFLIEDVLVAMELCPSSLRVYKLGCALFGAAYVMLSKTQNGPSPSQSSSHSSTAFSKTVVASLDQVGAPQVLDRMQRWQPIKQRMVGCLHQNGLLNHAMWDEDAKRLSQSALRMLLNNHAISRSVILHAEIHYCRGGAA